jgi:hypothetical protein
MSATRKPVKLAAEARRSPVAAITLMTLGAAPGGGANFVHSEIVFSL